MNSHYEGAWIPGPFGIGCYAIVVQVAVSPFTGIKVHRVGYAMNEENALLKATRGAMRLQSEEETRVQTARELIDRLMKVNDSIRMLKIKLGATDIPGTLVVPPELYDRFTKALTRPGDPEVVSSDWINDSIVLMSPEPPEAS